ncbi:myoneurin-like isoform X3 [Scyliorhinus canicula]|uniref:myoneurin-like isoform X3 n=1 Tax=Scyliorhinus canicula TaxID=7830 RepID=UPI0018F7622C|nr:myoneurin-like isoform X3 [Scyliorhinus canicula]
MAAAAGDRSGPAAQCHRAGPGPGAGAGGLEAGAEEEEEEERRRRRRQQQQGRALGLAAPCAVKQELEEQQEEEVVKVEIQQPQQEPEEEELEEEEEARPDCPLYSPAEAQAQGQSRSGASGRERQQFSEKRRILIVDEQQQRVEEAVLCQEVEWDRNAGHAGGLVWPRSESWSQDMDEPAKVLVSVADLRGQEQHTPKALQGQARDRPGASPAQRRRKSEYPRRRSCISFTFGGPEPSGGRLEEGDEQVDIRDLQRFGAAHRENGEAPASRLDLRTCGEALGELVGWTHSHCQGCQHLPSLRYLPPGSSTTTAVAVWACQAGHTYRWSAAGWNLRRRRRHRATKTVRSPAGVSDSQETERGPSSEQETERGLSSEDDEEEEEGSDADCVSNPVTSLRIVECELEEQGPGGRGPQPGWKVIPCKDERSEEEELEESLDPIEPLPELPVLKTAPVVLMKTKPGRGRWRAKNAYEEPEPEPDPAPESQWETHYWEKASPSAYPTPELHAHVVNSRELARERPGDTDPEMETETMQLICESVPDPDQKDESITLAGLAAAAGLPDSIREPELENSEEEEPELVETDDDVPFHDDPKDEMYEPSPHRERGKPRRKPRKEKEKLETVEHVEPPKRRPRRSKEDRGPRPPKKRKKPPIQYVRCEMEGCGTILANPRYLQHHMRYQHMLKKKYVCPHPSCGRLFRLQKQLLRHTKHHSDQRDYICEYCARAFKSSHNLAVHRMIHTGEKPLQCEICGFTCRQKASLNWHMKKHDADANYQFSCNVCGKKFEKKDSVVAHKSKSHPELVIAEALAESTEVVLS